MKKINRSLLLFLGLALVTAKIAIEAKSKNAHFEMQRREVGWTAAGALVSEQSNLPLYTVAGSVISGPLEDSVTMENTRLTGLIEQNAVRNWQNNPGEAAARETLSGRK